LSQPYATTESGLHATRAAVEEGIVAGGGVALIRAQKALDNLKLEGDEKTGLEIVRRAVESPLRQLADNAGQEGALIVQEVKRRSGNEGYNVATGEYVDLVKAGVVDPTKVTLSKGRSLRLPCLCVRSPRTLRSATSIIPLAHEPVNDPERGYRKSQS
jgi:chaperonin GroEL